MQNSNKLKSSGIYIDEDFFQRNDGEEKKALERCLRLQDEGKFAAFKYDGIISREFRK